MARLRRRGSTHARDRIGGKQTAYTIIPMLTVAPLYAENWVVYISQHESYGEPLSTHLIFSCYGLES